MWSRRAAGVVVGVAVAAVALRGQAVDFSGTWQLDRAQSHVAAETTTMWMQVEQGDAVLQVNLRAFHQAGGEENQFFTYSIGDVENHNTMHGAPMTSQVAWSNGGLSFHSDATFGADHLRMDDLWTLSSDQKVLTFRQTSQFGREAERQGLYVFTRRAATDWPPEQPPLRAEEAFANIKTLTGHPASEVPRVMTTFGQALGVPCSYCHVPGSWGLETQPPLSVAREMFHMTSTFAAGPLADRGGLTCWTCHRGQSKPARFPSSELNTELQKWPAELASSPDAVKLTMTVYARSLGVSCEFCHTVGDWQRHDKAPMQTMPVMLGLFRDLPALSPVAANRAQCWMCHQGHAVPERTPGR